ncbi:hypothetical protein [Guyparkeria sp. TX1]|uniref:hypothetical protein n=1 Tax=Guyparkeria sp. TX1 TaxID=3115001 RepID=UPI0039774C6E
MKKAVLTSVLPTVMLASAGAQAAEFDVGVNVGTLGIGPELGMTIVPNKFRARVTTGFGSYSETFTVDGNEYEGDLELRNAGLLGDYHPFGGYFRVTGGVIFNDNSYSAVGDQDSYEVQGLTVPAAPGDRITADVDFNPVAPYLGIGWSSANNEPGLSFRADIGVMYQGAPDATVDVKTSDPFRQPYADQYAEQEEKDLNDELEDYKLYPVVQVGLVYRF